MKKQVFVLNLSDSMIKQLKVMPKSEVEQKTREMIANGSGLQTTDIQLNFAVGLDKIMFMVYARTQEKADKIKEFFESYKSSK